MKKYAVVFFVILSLLLVASCAPGLNPNKDTPNEEGMVAGYWNGFWHGLIMPYSFIGSWFTDNVNIYEVHNNGLWYHLGLFTPGFIISAPFWITMMTRRPF